jgi:hypothetical protein
MSKPRIWGWPRKKRSVRRTSSMAGSLERLASGAIAPPSPRRLNTKPWPIAQKREALAVTRA